MPHRIDTLLDQVNKELRQEYELARNGNTVDFINWCCTYFAIVLHKIGINAEVLHTNRCLCDDTQSSDFIYIRARIGNSTYLVGEISASRDLSDLKDSAISQARLKASGNRPQHSVIAFAASFNADRISFDFWDLNGDHYDGGPRPLTYEDNGEDIEGLVAEFFAQE